MTNPWSNQMPVVQFRVARPTDKLDEIIRFYGEGLGLTRIGGFENHDGYDGVMFGLPGVDYHLEFTRHVSGSPCPAPTEDNLLVFYLPDRTARDAVANRLHEMGYPAVEPENPYWKGSGITIADPDGWRIVLQNTSGMRIG
ncbi:VOC family protein [Brevibacillus dissolubilis]|uniref:VOC family protein n=1 Tax=Brevibacillus dissolubilis TaxID=1844116 RepID=UPI001117ADED|nr:VOC family protein [Brevibacillus dissolubilis]